MNHLTNAKKLINYAVEVEYNDGPYVLCITQSIEVAKLVAASRVLEDEYGQYCVGKVIAYEAGQEVWLGFPFSHRKATPLSRKQVTEEQYNTLILAVA
jgi:hypothetical protein